MYQRSWNRLIDNLKWVPIDSKWYSQYTAKTNMQMNLFWKCLHPVSSYAPWIWLHHVCLIIWFISCYYDCCINWVISNSKVFSVTREAGRLTGFSVEGIIILSFMFTVYDLLFLVEFLLAQSLWIMSWSDKSGDHLAWTLGNHYSLFVDNILSIS